MNLDAILKKLVEKKTEKVGCGIRPGFGKKSYNKYNSLLFNMMENNKEFDLDNVVFRLFSSEDINNMIPITTRISEAFDLHKTGSVLDSRLGTFSEDKVCGTCCQTNLTCPGHYGYIQLATPIIHPLMYNYLFQLLRAVCNNCGELIADPKSLKGDSLERLNKAATLGTKKKICKNCGFINLSVVKRKLPIKNKNINLIQYSLPLIKATRDEDGTPLTMKEIEQFLLIVKDNTKKSLLIDETQLDSLIMKFLVVSPTNSRPPISITGIVENSNLTAMLDYFLKVNNDLKLDMTNVSKQNWLFHVIHRIINSETPSMSQIRQYVSIKSQLKGKDGYIRKNGVGKRMDFASRTVLSPASETCVGQFSYPLKATEEMTSPVIATYYNIEMLREKWFKGEIYAITPMTDNHPLYKQTIKWSLSIKDRYKPYLRDICHKHLGAGDLVLFNRQPTLDKYSLMGNFALITERNQRVNGLNSCVTKPHNADFDGDEGNVYVMQTPESQLEALLINNSRNNIISNSNGRPIISIQYHGIISLYMLTGENVILDEEDWEEGFDLFWDGKSALFPGNVHGYNNNTERKIKPRSNFEKRLNAAGGRIRTGKSLFSCILPEDFNYDKGGVTINLGILVKGTIDKGSVGGGNGNIIQVITNLYGTEAAADFLSSAQKMSDWYLSKKGLSLSLFDLNPVNYENQSLEIFFLQTNNRGIKEVSGIILENIHVTYSKIKNNQQPEGLPFVVEWVSSNFDVLKDREREFGLDSPYSQSIQDINNASLSTIEDKIKLLGKDTGLSVFEEENRENSIISITEVVNNTNRKKGIKLLGENNSLIAMYKSGAKGSEGNAAQLTSLIGQTMVYGSRFLPVIAATKKHPKGTRSMMFFEGIEDPLFNKNDVISKGYINSSYVRGLNGYQFIFMMSHERVGIITSRISTPVAGYLSRILYRFNDDLMIGSMGDVISAQNMFINYGMLDGLDDSKASIGYHVKHGKFYSPMNTQDIADKLTSAYLSANLP